MTSATRTSLESYRGLFEFDLNVANLRDRINLVDEENLESLFVLGQITGLEHILKCGK